MYSISHTKENTKFCLSLYYNWANIYLFVNRQRNSIQINSDELCLGNISKDCSVDNMKKTGLKAYIYNFSVDYEAISVSDITNIHKYLMEKNKIN